MVKPLWNTQWKIILKKFCLSKIVEYFKSLKQFHEIWIVRKTIRDNLRGVETIKNAHWGHRTSQIILMLNIYRRNKNYWLNFDISASNTN